MYPVTKKYVQTMGVSWYRVLYDPEHKEFRWVWHEVDEDDVIGPNYQDISSALLGAAYDWQTAGSRGNMATRLKLAAAQYGGSKSTTRHYG